MADSASRQTAAISVGRGLSTLFMALFALAAVIAAAATYSATTGANPASATRPQLFWLLIANLVIIAGVAGVFALRITRLMRENRQTQGGARLRLRIIILFSASAAIPTIIVAGFLAAAMNRQIENWFSEPVMKIVQSGRDAADATQQEYGAAAKEALDRMTDMLDGCAECKTNQAQFEGAVRLFAAFPQFKRVDLLSSKGELLLPFADPDAPKYVPPSPTLQIWKDGPALDLQARIEPDAVRVISRLKSREYQGSYLYVTRPWPPAVLEPLKRASEDLDTYTQANERRDTLSWTLLLCYFEAAMLLLLGVAWGGLAAATRIAQPIGQLAGAARAVRDGNFSVRMRRPDVRDEIDDLADAFNQMTERIAVQTRALDRSRQEAEARSAFTEAVLAGVEAGVVRIDSALNVTIANASARAMLDMPEPGGEDDGNLVQIAPEFVPAARHALETGQSAEATVKRQTEAGVLHVQARIAPEADGGGAVITFHDTTRLVLGQRQAAWRDVARRIAHEIRNPLTPIQLSAERLRRRFSGQIANDRETFDRCTDTIMRQVADIGRMVEEFSDFARMPKPTFHQFNLNDMVQSVAFAQRMRTTSIAVNVNLPERSLAMLGDERLLAQALTNVVKNAAEAVERAMEAGDIKGGAVWIDVDEQGGDVELSVRDNGPGFPVEDRDRLLEPYVTTRKNGVGLGLAIVTRIIEDHGGRISLGDNAQRGARVDIRMPLSGKPSEAFVDLVGEGAA